MHCRLISDLDKNAHAELQDRGLQYGDGLFETMLLDNGEIRFWSAHYRRLQRSAHRLQIVCPPQQWLEQQLQPYFALQQRLVIKLILTRGCGGRGIQFPLGNKPLLYLLHYDASATPINRPVEVTVSPVTLPDNPNLAGLKHLNRLDYVLASAALANTPRYSEALLCNAQGHVIEGIVNNLFFIRDDVFYTPDLAKSGVDGVMRQALLKNLKLWGKTVKIGHYTVQDVLAADECLVCNSVQGIRPIVAIDHQAFNIGALTLVLQQRIYPHEGD